jgi:hypothetical protein
VTAIFPFVQFEFSHNIGPPPGRYLVSGPMANEEAPALAAEAFVELLGGDVSSSASAPVTKLGGADVLVIRVSGARAARPRRLNRRAPQAFAEEEPELSVTLVTVIKGTRMLSGADAAERLLVELRGSSEAQQQWIDDALAIVNRAVCAYRACAVDPYAIDVGHADPRAIRVGYGPASELTRGAWSAAVTVRPVPQPRLDRATRLMPTQGMAAVLAGRSRTLEAEELILRVVLDLEHGRNRAAAAGLRAAHGLLIAELGEQPIPASVRERLESVARAEGAISALAERATTEPLSGEQVTRLGELTEELGALVDTWRYQSA